MRPASQLSSPKVAETYARPTEIANAVGKMRLRYRYYSIRRSLSEASTSRRSQVAYHQIRARRPMVIASPPP